MSIFNKPLESITEEDLRSLVENEVRELKHIEYKQCAPGHKDAQKKDFLGDVSSFANATGGDLVYGIKEKKGLPIELCGLQTAEVDGEILRLDSMIRESIRPRIPGIAPVREVKLKEGGAALIIRVPRSWAMPHMVTYRGHDRFYARSSNGKHPMDVSEIRAAFALSETTAERIRNFRAERLARIVSGGTPATLPDNPKTVLHLIPLGAFDPAARLDLSGLEENRDLPPLIMGRVTHRRYNFDGFLGYTQPGTDAPDGYTQVFRNGIVESVDSFLLREDNRIVWTWEKRLRQAVSKFLSLQKQLRVEPLIMVMLTLLAVEGYIMVPCTEVDVAQGENTPIDRNDLAVPEVMVETLDAKPDEVLKPIFDTIWNAAGWPRSMNYDEAGCWNPMPE